MSLRPILASVLALVLGVSVTASSAPGGVVTGKVLADDGVTPRAGVVVALFDPDTSAEFRSAPTDAAGAFRVEVRGLAAARVSAREVLRFGPPQPEAVLEADLILDLTGAQPWFPGHDKRDGYLRPDPKDPVAVQKALFDAVELEGVFDKPRYVAFTAELCAHSRSRKTGCTRCLDVCPTGAITPAGDTVAIDPYVCAGCGACAGVCPTGAAAYAAPAANTQLERSRALLGAYRAAGGSAPVLLVHEERHGEELIAAMARRGRGLPARVLPLAVGEVAQLGLDFLTAAFQKSQELIDGQVVLSLYRGNVMPIGRSSPSSLYDQNLSSMDIEGGFDQTDSRGFIRINALRLKAHRVILNRAGQS